MLVLENSPVSTGQVSESGEQGSRALLTAELDPRLTRPNVFAISRHQNENSGVLFYNLFRFWRSTVYGAGDPGDESWALTTYRTKLNRNGIFDHGDTTVVNARLLEVGSDVSSQEGMPMGFTKLGLLAVLDAYRADPADLTEMESQTLQELGGQILHIVEWNPKDARTILGGNGGRPLIADPLAELFSRQPAPAF